MVAREYLLLMLQLLLLRPLLHICPFIIVDDDLFKHVLELSVLDFC